jgi:hypothetical protein
MTKIRTEYKRPFRRRDSRRLTGSFVVLCRVAGVGLMRRKEGDSRLASLSRVRDRSATLMARWPAKYEFIIIITVGGGAPLSDAESRPQRGRRRQLIGDGHGLDGNRLSARQSRALHTSPSRTRQWSPPSPPRTKRSHDERGDLLR